MRKYNNFFFNETRAHKVHNYDEYIQDSKQCSNFFSFFSKLLHRNFTFLKTIHVRARTFSSYYHFSSYFFLLFFFEINFMRRRGQSCTWPTSFLFYYKLLWLLNYTRNMYTYTLQTKWNDTISFIFIIVFVLLLFASLRNTSIIF